MIAPSHDIMLSGGLCCVAAPIAPQVWHEHVVKHPLGVHAIASSRGLAPWNGEGWDKTTPPVVTESERVTLVQKIGGLSSGKMHCGVPEIRGDASWSHLKELACTRCPSPLFVPCERLCRDVSLRYASVTEELLKEVAEGAGLHVTRELFTRALLRLWRAPEKIEGLTVLTLGLEERRGDRPIARISRHDGVRVEMSFEEPDRLRWRTTYRELAAVKTRVQQISFVSAMLQPADRMGPLSEICVVARHWWETHGI